MKLRIKWAEIEVESQEEALEIIQEIERVINLHGNYFQWDYEIQEDDPE